MPGFKRRQSSSEPHRVGRTYTLGTPEDILIYLRALSEQAQRNLLEMREKRKQDPNVDITSETIEYVMQVELYKKIIRDIESKKVRGFFYP